MELPQPANGTVCSAVFDQQRVEFRERSGTWPSLEPAVPLLEQPSKSKRRKRTTDSSTLPAGVSSSSGTSQGQGQPKKTNPWGEASYAELITQALSSANEGKMKLNEVYQWFADNILYFRERSHPEQAAGWKNSIRHNLSLHHRFKRIPNETSGKSSWWVIDPDGEEKTRRRAKTIDNSNKPLLDKKRREAKSKSAKARARMASGGAVAETAALTVADQPNGGMDFRQRSESNVSTLSVPGTLHHSPTFELEGPTTDSLLWPPPSQRHTNAFNVNSEVPDDLLLRAGDIKLEPDDRLTSPTSANQNLTGQQNGPITGQQQFSQGAVAPNGLYSFQLQQSTSKMETTMDKSAPLVVQSDIIEPEAASTSAFPPANQQPTIGRQQQNSPFFGQPAQRTFCHQPPLPLPNYSSQFYFSQQQQQHQHFLPPSALDPTLPADLQNIKLEPLIACNIPDVLGHEFKAAGRLDFDTNMAEGL